MPVDAQLATEQWMRYQYCRDRGHLQFLEKAHQCEEFFAGNQWSQADMTSLRLQRRPALTINKILSTLSTVFGVQIENRAEILFKPSYGSPAETAEALNKVWMQIAQNNQLQWVRSELFADGCIRGRGFLDTRLDFSDSLQGEVRITNLNSKNVVIDPDAEEYDPDSWSDVHVTKWLTPQDIAILYSKGDADILKNRDGSAYPYGYDSVERVRDRFGGNQLLAGYYGILDQHNVRRNVRVLERQYRRLDKAEHFVNVRTGDMRQVPSEWDRDRIAFYLQNAGPDVSVVKKLVRRIRWTVTADNLVLHDDWSPYKHFTVVPYFPIFRYGKTVGLVENLIGSQELLNKTSSQELHVVNTTANSGWKLKTGALKNMSVEELEMKGAQTGLVLELDDVAAAEKIQPNATPQGLDRISYKAEEHIKGISGVSDSMQGFDREDVAAKAIQTKRSAGATNMGKPLDNLARTDWILARNVLDMVQAHYIEERLFTITHNDPAKELETVAVNQWDEGEQRIVNDLTVGEYSITVTSQPYRESLEDSQFDQALAMRERGIAIPDSVLVENSRLLRKQEIIKAMEGDKDSPEAQQRAQLELRALEAEVATAEAEAMSKKADAELKMAKAQEALVSAQNGAGGESPEAKMAEIEVDAQLQREKMDREFALKTEQMEREFALKERQFQQEAEIRQQQASQDAEIKQKDAIARRAQGFKQDAQQPTGDK
mgnify:CR=1 FL=1